MPDPDAPTTPDAPADATDPPESAGVPRLDPARRKAVIWATAVAAVVIAVVLGYSVVRDPGPQPTTPPKISGTDDRALKRAIVHYVGALEHRDVEALVALSGDVYDDEVARFQARAAVEGYGDSAQQRAAVTVEPDADAGVQHALIRFDDGGALRVEFTDQGGWHSLAAARPDPALPPASSSAPTASAPTEP